MSNLVVTQFMGANLMPEPKLVPDQQGVISRNQKPGRGDLRAWRKPTQVMLAPSQTKRETIYRMGPPSDTNYWLTWATVVHTARGFDVEDTTDRTAYTGDGVPKITDNLSLRGGSPSLNPITNRPLGLPAPSQRPSVSINLAAADPNEGKYSMGLRAADVVALKVGDTARVTVEGTEPQEFTFSDGGGGRVTVASLAQQLDSLAGISAHVTDKDDEKIPLGVYVVSDQVGKSWTLERLTGTKENLDPTAVSYQPLLSATGGSGTSTPIYVTQAPASGNYSFVIPTATVSSFAAGDRLTITVSGTTRVSAQLTGNSPSSVVAAIVSTGVSAAEEPASPPYYNGDDGTGYAGSPGGVRVVVGATAANASVQVLRNASSGAVLVVTKAFLDGAAKPGDRWQIYVNQAAPTAVVVAAGAGTYPPAVTPASVKAAIGKIDGLDFSEETTPSGPQLRITNRSAGASSRIVINKIVAGTAKIWGGLATAVVVAPAKRNVDTYFYAYTFVNDWGWESAPSPVSEPIERTIKESATLSNFAAPPAGSYNINRLRIYRTQAGTTGTADFFFLLEASISTPTLVDDNRTLGETLPGKNWLPAPGVPRGGDTNFTEPNLSFLTPLWNGMLAGIVGKSVRFCEPYTPYAWPIEYDIVPATGDPVALGVFGQQLLVLTTGRPVLVGGSTPEAMDDMPMEIPQGCIASRSVVSMGSGVAWASNDGLCWYGAGGPRILTAKSMLREDWLKLRPETIIGQMYEGIYFGSYEPSPGATRKGFLIDPSGGGIYFMDEGFDAAHFDDAQDQLYLLRGNRILKWEADPEFMPAVFRSKVFRQPSAINFGVAEIVATGYPVQFVIWADGVQRYSKTVTSRNTFPLPSGFVGMDWQIEVSTPGGAVGAAVQAVILASNAREISKL